MKPALCRRCNGRLYAHLGLILCRECRRPVVLTPREQSMLERFHEAQQQTPDYAFLIPDSASDRDVMRALYRKGCLAYDYRPELDERQYRITTLGWDAAERSEDKLPTQNPEPAQQYMSSCGCVESTDNDESVGHCPMCGEPIVWQKAFACAACEGVEREHLMSRMAGVYYCQSCVPAEVAA